MKVKFGYSGIDQRAEFVGQLIDIFEDFLEARKITLPNPERDEDESAAIIYGSDYGDLRDKIESTLKNWSVMEDE